ncbi:MAG: hypothetical protein HOO93_15950 [Methyloglobulus sp.]|nr:hypothetical protein [Methyloglobulus sp.]
MSYLPSSPKLANLADVLAKYPGRGILLYKLLQDFKGSGFSLSSEIRELIVTYTLDLNGCGFCQNTHKAVFAAFDLDANVFGQLSTDIGTANIGENLKPLLRFVQKLTLTPDQITPTDAQPIFDAGWDEQAFLESVFLCAIVNCVNRVVMGAGLDVDYSLAYKAGINDGQPILHQVNKENDMDSLSLSNV